MLFIEFTFFLIHPSSRMDFSTELVAMYYEFGNSVKDASNAALEFG